MFKNRSLGAKIISGFMLMTVFVAIAGGVGYNGINVVGEALYIVGDKEAPVVEMANDMKRALLVSRLAMEEFMAATAVLGRRDEQAVSRLAESYRQSVVDYGTFTDAILEGRALDGGIVVIKSDNKKLSELVRRADQVHNEKFQVTAQELMDVGRQLLAQVEVRDQAMLRMEQAYEEIVDLSDRFEKVVKEEIAKKRKGSDGGDDSIIENEMMLVDMAMETIITACKTRIRLEEYAQANSLEGLAAIGQEYEETVEEFEVWIDASLNGGDTPMGYVNATENQAIREVIAELDRYHDDRFQVASRSLIDAQRKIVGLKDVAEATMARLDVVGDEAELLLTKAQELAAVEMATAKADGAAVRQSATVALISIVGGTIVIGVLIGVFLTRSITGPVNRIIAGLNEGADQVNDAASQVSSASQQSAEGASEQASSLEETSSALEQMAAMTRTNAENAKQAGELSTQARDAAQAGDKTMHKLNEAMTAINQSSGRISKIIKVIEEIAFQTNLLALNAAVEAARAGEHGKGFAVVADEVRNLAQRAAQAARETTGLIEDSTNKAKEGTEVAGEVGRALGAIVADVTKVTDLVNGITKASQEQAQGVDQVNTAVSQMDKVTQQNAAGAEESASASEQLAAQAQALKGMVQELGGVIRGKSGQVSTAPASHSVDKKNAGKTGKRLNAHVPNLHRKPDPDPVAVGVGKGAGVDSSQAFMALGEEDMKGF